MSNIKKGIDVSYAQGNVDFAKIDKSEVQFAIVRSSFGWEQNQKDKQCDRNIKGFQALGIPCGVYHYSYATNRNEAIKEAEYCISCIKDYTLELPVFFDIEESNTAKLGKRICTDIVKAFCDYMINAGYNAGVYCNLNWINNYLYKDELIGKYDIWLAQWGSANPGCDCELWQYNVGKSGAVKGISGEIDLNYMYKDYGASSSANTTTDSQLNSSAKVDYSVTVTSTNGVNLRSGAGTSYTVKGAVPCNVTLKITRQTSGGGYTWGYTTYNGITGWIALDYTKKITTAQYHTVVRDDTLSWIAYKYNTTVDNLVKLNNIVNKDVIYIGQKIRVK